MGLFQSVKRVSLQGLRVVSAVAGIAGAAMLYRGLSQGTQNLVPLFIGGVLLLLGIIGVIDPKRVVPSGDTAAG